MREKRVKGGVLFDGALSEVWKKSQTKLYGKYSRERSHSVLHQARLQYQKSSTKWEYTAVHRGARPDRSTTAARELAKGFFKLRAAQNDSSKTSLDELDRVERHLNQGAAFSDWLGIRVYEPVLVEGEAVWHLRRNPPAKLTNILTIGIYEGHAFLIKDISKLARTYACVHCRARFTQTYNLQRHTERCAQGKTVIDCPAERVEAPADSFREGLLPKTLCFPRITSVA